MNIRQGDEVWVKAKVLSTYQDRDARTFEPRQRLEIKVHGGVTAISECDVMKHFPQSLKVGDTVEFKTTTAVPATRYKIVAIDEDLAWLKNPDGRRQTGYLSALVRV